MTTQRAAAAAARSRADVRERQEIEELAGLLVASAGLLERAHAALSELGAELEVPAFAAALWRVPGCGDALTLATALIAGDWVEAEHRPDRGAPERVRVLTTDERAARLLAKLREPAAPTNPAIETALLFAQRWRPEDDR